jgi:dTDP-4-dehydrorhamnose reductase
MIAQRILLFGADGQVGWKLSRALRKIGTVTPLTRLDVDLTNPVDIRQSIADIKPDIVVNAAAYTQVDHAERELALANAVNGEAPAVMAEATKRIGGVIVHYSTDYVFDGCPPLDDLGSPRAYLESDPTSPVNAYGSSKLLGENAILGLDVPSLVLRTSWVFDERRTNFVLTMLRLAKDRTELSVVDDQIGGPNYAGHLALATAAILSSGPSDAKEVVRSSGGLFHLSVGSYITWHNLAQETLSRAGAFESVKPLRLLAVPTSEYPTPAKRPAWSALDPGAVEATFGVLLPSWQAGLSACLDAVYRGTP